MLRLFCNTSKPFTLTVWAHASNISLTLALQVKLGLSIDEDELAAEDDDLPPLEEDAVDEGSRMEEVD